MKVFPIVLMTILILTSSVEASSSSGSPSQRAAVKSSPTDINILRKKYYEKVFKELVPKKFTTEEMKKEMLKKGKVENLSQYDSPQYAREQNLAYLWLEYLYRKNELSSFAKEFNAKAGIGVEMESRKNPLKSFARQVFGWPYSLVNYKNAIEKCKETNKCNVFDYEKWPIEGKLGWRSNKLIVYMAAAYVAVLTSFVEEKMKLFDETMKEGK